jgi:hypothetical protein
MDQNVTLDPQQRNIHAAVADVSEIPSGTPPRARREEKKRSGPSAKIRIRQARPIAGMNQKTKPAVDSGAASVEIRMRWH